VETPRSKGDERLANGYWRSSFRVRVSGLFSRAGYLRHGLHIAAPSWARPE